MRTPDRAGSIVILTILGWFVACGGTQQPESAPAEKATITSVETDSVTPSDPDDAGTAPAKAPAPTVGDQERLVRAERVAFAAAKPVFEEFCESCHTGTAKQNRKALKHFNMDGYPFTGHHAHELGAVIRKVLGVGGGKATMPKNDKGAVVGAKLELVAAWSRAFDAAHEKAKAGDSQHEQPGKHHDHGSGHKH